MKILVTGANGYLGQGVVKALLDNGHSVVAADFKTNYVDLEQIFPMMGIRFIAINDNYDNANTESSDSDSIVVPFKNLLNDSYCRDISIKVRSQLDMKRRKSYQNLTSLNRRVLVELVESITVYDKEHIHIQYRFDKG